jgi:HipA-like protein
MLKDVFRSFVARFRAEGQEEIITPQGVEATFRLQYGDLKVGELSVKDAIWRFSYDPEFQTQDDIQPLVAFPDKRRTYESPVLWPFFMARIPGVNQPEVKETIRNEGLDEHSAVDLLRRFGEKTISNPFVLQRTP